MTKFDFKGLNLKSYMTTSIDRLPQIKKPFTREQLLQRALSLGLITVLIAPLVGCGQVQQDVKTTVEAGDASCMALNTPVKCAKAAQANEDKASDYQQCYTRYQDDQTCKYKNGDPYKRDVNGNIIGGLNNPEFKNK